MNDDAQEAAMGLLSLSPSNVPPSQPLVPLKRKHPSSSSGNVKRRPSNKVIQPQQQNEPSTEADNSTETISCICGSSYDDGFSIACDDCSRWCHAACFDIVQGEVPEEWKCWECFPRPVDRERAARIQKSRQSIRMREEQLLQQRQMQSPADSHRRRASPGLERKPRRTSMAAIEGSSTSNSRRKRRASFALPQPDDDPDVVVDIDEPWSHSYVPITRDIVPSTTVRDRIRKHAQSWRGITALSSLPPPSERPRVAVHPLPSSPSSDIRPPSYTVHTTTPIPSESLITPFTSTITPSATYLADPLNAYAHLGFPKPFVHLLGHPLDVALDARIAGDEARFVRSGCRPNAVLRPVLCRHPRTTDPKERSKDHQSTANSNGEGDERTLAFAVFALRDLKAHEEVVLGWEWDDGHAIHKLPTLIQTPELFPPAHQTHLRAQMSNILHLLSSTFTTCACGSQARNCALRQMERFVDGLPFDSAQAPPSNQHGSNSHFHPPFQPASGVDLSYPPDSRERQGSVENVDDSTIMGRADLGPLVGAARGFRTRERLVGSGGMGGVEMWVDDEDRGEGPSRIPMNGDNRRAGSELPGQKSGQRVEVEVDAEETEDELEHGVWHGADPNGRSRDQSRAQPPPISNVDQERQKQFLGAQDQRQTLWQLRPPDPPPPPLHENDPPDDLNFGSEAEDKMPPKMRKRWMHREAEALKVITETENATADRGIRYGEVGLGLGMVVESEGGEGGSVEPRDQDTNMEVNPMAEGTKQNEGGETKKEDRMDIDHDGHRGRELSQDASSSDQPNFNPEKSPSILGALATLGDSFATSPTPPQPLLPSTIFPVPRPASTHDSSHFNPSLHALTHLLSTDSPSTSFARLSLFSPAISQVIPDTGTGSHSPQILHGDLGKNVQLLAIGSDGESVAGAGSVPPPLEDQHEREVVKGSQSTQQVAEQPSRDSRPSEGMLDCSHQGVDVSRTSPGLHADNVSPGAMSPPVKSSILTPPAVESINGTSALPSSGSDVTIDPEAHAESEALPPQLSPSLPASSSVSADSRDLPSAELTNRSPPPPIRVRTPTPPPQPPQKVKMSLKDYKLRKQKRREEEEKEKAAAAASGLGTSNELNPGGYDGTSTNPSVAGSVGNSTETSPVLHTVGLAPEGDGALQELQVPGANGQAIGINGSQSSSSAPDYPPVSTRQDGFITRVGSIVKTEVIQDESMQVDDRRQISPPIAPPPRMRSPNQLAETSLQSRLQTLPLDVRDSATTDLRMHRTPGVKTLPERTHLQIETHPVTLQAKTELIDLPIPPLVPTRPEYKPEAGSPIARINGDSANYFRYHPEQSRISAPPNQSPSTPHHTQSSQEDGEISLGEDTPSPQPPSSRSIPPASIRHPAPYTPHLNSPPKGPRALLSNTGAAQPARRMSSAPYQYPPQPSTPLGAPAAPYGQISRPPPTGPRSLRVGGYGHYQHSRTLPPRGPANQHEGGSVPDWGDRNRARPGAPPLRRQSIDREGSATPSVPDDMYERRPLGPPRGPSTDRERGDRERERVSAMRGSGWGR